MSNRSFINRAAEERRQRLVVGGIVLPGAGSVGRFELIEHGVHRLVGIGDLALPLHRVEIVHIGLIGLFIVAEHAHRTCCPKPVEKESYSMTFGTRKKWLTVSGAFRTTSSAISPSV